MIEITTPSRIHITLIDLNASIGRMDGGIGLALEKPNIKIRAEESDEVKIEGPLNKKAKEAARKTLDALKIEGGIYVRVEDAYGQHIGLGSGTQISLAVGKAICEIYGIELGVRELAEIVGRGGTSGIGTAAFEHGGFILDGGHSTKEKKDFLPSSASKASPAPLLARYDFPDWKLFLIIPKIREEFSGRREVNIFQQYCPIPIQEVQSLSHIILMKLLPSLVEKDLESFGQSINQIQNTGFKKIEVGLQTPQVRDLMSLCKKYSYGVGLSSFGPVIYSIPKDEKTLLYALENKEVEVLSTKASNAGAKILRLD